MNQEAWAAISVNASMAPDLLIICIGIHCNKKISYTQALRVYFHRYADKLFTVKQKKEVTFMSRQNYNQQNNQQNNNQQNNNQQNNQQNNNQQNNSQQNRNNNNNQF